MRELVSALMVDSIKRIAELETQLRQEREANGHWKAEHYAQAQLHTQYRREAKAEFKRNADDIEGFQAQVAQLQTAISQYRKTLADLQPRTFPFDCEICGKVIESTADYDWHGIGDCAPICGTCDGNGFVATITPKPKEKTE